MVGGGGGNTWGVQGTGGVTYGTLGYRVWVWGVGGMEEGSLMEGMNRTRRGGKVQDHTLRGEGKHLSST